MATAQRSSTPVAGDGWISDESSFYGDDETKDDLEQTLANASTTDTFWRLQPSLPASIAYANRPDSLLQNTNGNPKTRTYWPLDGNQSARQSTESVAAFIKRLPPSRSNSQHGEWLWITNPAVAPHDPPDLEALMPHASTLLEEFRKFKGTLESQGMASNVVGRKLTPRRIALVEALKQVAVNAHCLSGKWMLFVPEPNIDETWSTVAHAVAEKQLGPVAKVATAAADREAGVRLVCVYTKDFTDLKDVRRVLDVLVSLGLVDTDSRGIYYKCDAYTHLGIDSKNEYGLKASMYGSKDMLQKPSDSKR